jgi:Pvc16 N-terminal domain
VANYKAVFAVGDALARYLQNNYDQANLGFTCTFKLFSSLDIASESQANDQMVSLFLHRLTTNENFRAVNRLQDTPGEQPVLFLDLHYLMTYWGSSAEAEQTILTWTMQQLQSSPILDLSILGLSTVDAGFDKTEIIQLMPADLSLEDILRIWDALGPKYRLSISYLARVVRVDRTITPGLPVVATRFIFQDGGLS